MNRNDFTPKLYTIFKEGISKEQLYKDGLSGIIVGIVALPLALAFAIASGVSPDKGLVTAVIAGLIISIFGGSRVQIGGPTGAFIVIVYSIVQKHGVDGLTVATFLAGIMIIGMGIARLGNLLKFIPYPLIVGFTSGIAVIIFSSQMKNLLGLQMEAVPADFLEKWIAYASHSESINFYALAIGLGTITLSIGFGQLSKKIPAALLAIVGSTAIVHYFNLPVDTIQSAFGEISGSFTSPHIPNIDFTTLKELLQPAMAIALLGGIESLLSAVVADGMIGARHRSNMELIAQGAANIGSAIFGGIPATGAIARTATNIKNGGRTPIAGIVHALVLLGIMLLFAPLAELIPLSCLAGILIIVAYNMSEWRNFSKLLKSPMADVAILISTFLLTVFVDLVVAIELGIVLSSLSFMKRMSDMNQVANMLNDDAENSDNENLFDQELTDIPKGVVLYEINGPLFFGAAQKFQDTFRDIGSSNSVLVIRMRHVPFIDATGLLRLKEMVQHFNHQQIEIVLSGVNDTVLKELRRSNIDILIGSENILPNIRESLIRAREIIHELHH